MITITNERKGELRCQIVVQQRSCFKARRQAGCFTIQTHWQLIIDTRFGISTDWCNYCMLEAVFCNCIPGSICQSLLSIYCLRWGLSVYEFCMSRFDSCLDWLFSHMGQTDPFKYQPTRDGVAGKLSNCYGLGRTCTVGKIKSVVSRWGASVGQTTDRISRTLRYTAYVRWHCSNVAIFLALI